MLVGYITGKKSLEATVASNSFHLPIGTKYHLLAIQEMRLDN